MALSTVKLSKYAEQLSVSDKRRYLEKIEEIGDPYSYESSNLQVDLLPPVRSTDIFNYTWCFPLVFVRVNGLKHIGPWTLISILLVALLAKSEEDGRETILW